MVRLLITLLSVVLILAVTRHSIILLLLLVIIVHLLIGHWMVGAGDRRDRVLLTWFHGIVGIETLLSYLWRCKAEPDIRGKMRHRLQLFLMSYRRSCVLHTLHTPCWRTRPWASPATATRLNGNLMHIVLLLMWMTLITVLLCCCLLLIWLMRLVDDWILIVGIRSWWRNFILPTAPCSLRICSGSPKLIVILGVLWHTILQIHWVMLPHVGTACACCHACATSRII